jgi:hypothetical protein
MGVHRGVVESDRVLRRLADRRPGQLEKQHLTITGGVGVARDRQRTERLARKLRAFDRKALRFRRDHGEAERLREIGAEADAVAGHVGADAMHHDRLQDRAVQPRLRDRGVAVLAFEHRQDPGEGRAADLAHAAVRGRLA